MAKQNDNHTEKTFTCSECGRTYKDHAGLHKWNSNYHDSFIRCRVDGAVCMEDEEAKVVEPTEPEVPGEGETEPEGTETP